MKNKSRIPVQKRSIDTKSKIIDAGEYLFSKKGFYKTGSKDIAKHAKVAIGSFYAYFKNKKEVLIEALERYNEKIFLSIKNFQENKNDLPEPEKFISGLIYNIINAHNILPDFHEEIIYIMHTDAEIKKMMQNYINDSITVTVDLLGQIKDKLKVKDIKTASKLITIVIEETVHHIIFNNPEDKEKIVNELSMMVYNYLF